MPKLLVPVSLVIALASIAVAQPKTYDFRDPKRVNTVAFIADSALEPILGIASDVRGKLAFDPTAPEKTTGTITVKARSVHVTNKLMKEKLHGAEWLGVGEHRNIRLTFEKVVRAKAPDGKKPKYPHVAIGTFRLKGVEKRIEAPIRFGHFPGKAKERNRHQDGDLLVVRSQFSISRSAFGVGEPYPIVADEVQVRVAIVGCWVKPKQDVGR